MTSNAVWKHKKASAFTKTTRSRCSATLLDNDVTNSTCQPVIDLLCNESFMPSKEQCAKTHKKVAASINIKRKRCPSPLLDNDETNPVYKHINEDCVSSRTSGVLDNRNKSIKKKHSSNEQYSGKAWLPEAKTPPKFATWGLEFFYRRKNEPKCNNQVSVWESNYYFRPKKEEQPMCKESLKINKKQAVEARRKTSTQQNYQQARPANVSKANLVQCANSKISKANTLQVPAKLGYFDDLDEIPALFKGETDE